MVSFLKQAKALQIWTIDHGLLHYSYFPRVAKTCRTQEKLHLSKTDGFSGKKEFKKKIVKFIFYINFQKRFHFVDDAVIFV